jgi:hypothetical protein
VQQMLKLQSVTKDLFIPQDAILIAITHEIFNNSKAYTDFNGDDILALASEVSSKLENF